MPLMAVLPSIDDVDEAVKSLYQQKKIRARSTWGKDGKEIPGPETDAYVLDLAELDSHPSVIALSNALERQKRTNSKAVADLEALKSKFAGLPDDFTIEQWEELKAHAEAHDNPPAGETPEEKAKRLKDGQAAIKLAEQKLERLVATHATEIGKKDAIIKDLNAYINKLLIDEGLARVLGENGIKPNFMKAAKALLRENCKVVGEGDDRHAVYETSDLGDVPLDKFVKEWAAGDEGKEFVKKPVGAGAPGGEGSPNGPTGKNPFAKKKEDGYNLTQQGAILRDNPTLARKLMKDAGWTEQEIARGAADQIAA